MTFELFFFAKKTYFIFVNLLVGSAANYAGHDSVLQFKNSDSISHYLRRRKKGVNPKTTLTIRGKCKF
jgi:hypothetical protein